MTETLVATPDPDPENVAPELRKIETAEDLVEAFNAFGPANVPDNVSQQIVRDLFEYIGHVNFDIMVYTGMGLLDRDSDTYQVTMRIMADIMQLIGARFGLDLTPYFGKVFKGDAEEELCDECKPHGECQAPDTEDPANGLPNAELHHVDPVADDELRKLFEADQAEAEATA